MQKHKMQYLKNVGNTVHCEVPVVYPHEHVADWKLWLAAQYHISQAWGKVKIQNSMYGYN